MNNIEINKDKIIEKLALKIAQLEVNLATEQSAREELVARVVELEDVLHSMQETDD